MRTEETTEKRENQGTQRKAKQPRNTVRIKFTKSRKPNTETTGRESRELRCRNDRWCTVRYDLWEVVIQHWLKLIYVSFVPRYLNPTNEIPKPQYLRDHLKRRMRRQ